MLNCFVSKPTDKIIPIIPIAQDDFTSWIKNQSGQTKNIIAANRFLAEPGSHCLIIDQKGDLEKVLLGLENKNDFYSFGALPKVLLAGCYDIDAPDFSQEQLEHAAIGWGLGSYQFKQYKELKDFDVKLLCKENHNIAQLESIVGAAFLVRDLINTPAGDLYPERLGEIAADLAKEHQAELKIIRGEELAVSFPAVHAVGKGSDNKPILIDLSYGDPNNPKIALVGKGVCFDSGGLQIKSSSGMTLMKKDMAGGAHALGLAKMVMEAKLPVNLRLIIPAVENLISGCSIKPGDVIKTRKGLSVEVNNTDAEGRLILADALALASELQPDLILDFATLTGAARIALGPDITALFANDDQLIQDVVVNMSQEQEPVWQLPLYRPYLDAIKADRADLSNIVKSADFGGGAIVAALFLEQFVDAKIKWAHFDMNAYNLVSKPGKPEGGEADCLRGVFRFLVERFGGSNRLVLAGAS